MKKRCRNKTNKHWIFGKTKTDAYLTYFYLSIFFNKEPSKPRKINIYKAMFLKKVKWGEICADK